MDILAGATIILDDEDDELVVRWENPGPRARVEPAAEEAVGATA
ncbi:MAG TPA: hypothetical protein VFD90_14070 [Gaiellales bacterium]|jgi:hypothetical protein|nr:hypothetical protein [Gaiellales bacterium]